jgi:TfuA protein
VSVPSPTDGTPASTKTIVFYGPSIGEAEISQLIEATHAPPVKRGDLEAAGECDVIVILDGEFGQSMSVSPKEILSLLERGKTVIGASSMGALRASELDRHGMIGVGWVYEHFRRSTVRRDADVALVYAPFDFKPMTVPMVDVEYWMEQAAAAGLIADRERTLLLKTARKIFFAERTEERLMESLRRAVGAPTLEQVLAFSGGTIPNVKHADALEAVRLAASLAARHEHAREG